MNSFLEALRQTTTTSSRVGLCLLMSKKRLCFSRDLLGVSSVGVFHTEQFASYHHRQYCQSFSVSEIEEFAALLGLYFLSYLY